MRLLNNYFLSCLFCISCSQKFVEPEESQVVPKETTAETPPEEKPRPTVIEKKNHCGKTLPIQKMLIRFYQLASGPFRTEYEKKPHKWLEENAEALCVDAQWKQNFQNEIVSLIQTHQQKVALFLPKNSAKAQKLLQGFRRYFDQEKKSFDNHVVVVDSEQAKMNLEQTLSNLYFKDRVSFFIGGYDSTETFAMNLWSSRLPLPTIYMTDKSEERKNTNSFYAFPSQDQYVASTILSGQKLGYKKFALIASNDSTFDLYFKEFQKQLGVHQSAVYSLRYKSKDFNSVDQTAKKILQIDPKLRSDEYKKLVQQNPNKSDVFLPPIIDFDAIILLDEARMARHWIKILQFYGVRQLPLIGIQEWRSSTLIKPYDRFLDQAFFMDLIPPLHQIIKTFPEQRVTHDFQMDQTQITHWEGLFTGYYLAKQLDIVKLLEKKTRTDIIKDLRGKASKPPQVVSWPFQLIQVRSGQFQEK